MKCISVHLELDRNTHYSEQDLISLLKSIGRYPEIERSADFDDKTAKALNPDGVNFVNLHFFSEDLADFWQQFVNTVMNDSKLGAWFKQVAIVASDGVADDAEELLLYHYDSNEKLDTL